MRVLASRGAAARPVTASTEQWRATAGEGDFTAFAAFCDPNAHRMMAAMGYRGGGLGRNGEGISTSDIVQPKPRLSSKGGLGLEVQGHTGNKPVDDGLKFFFTAGECGTVADVEPAASALGITGPGPPDTTGPGPPKRRRRLVRPPPTLTRLAPVPAASASYSGPPTDDLETPAWVLACILAALRYKGGARQSIIDPFYSTGAVVREWASIGVDCTHTTGDFFAGAFRDRVGVATLVTFPPMSKLVDIIKELQDVPRWALLVPRAFTESTSIRGCKGLAMIHIVKEVSFTYSGYPMGSPRRMSWLLKGIDIPRTPLHTHDASSFWCVSTGECFTADFRPVEHLTPMVDDKHGAVPACSMRYCDKALQPTSALGVDYTGISNKDEPSPAWRHLRYRYEQAAKSSCGPSIEAALAGLVSKLSAADAKSVTVSASTLAFITRALVESAGLVRPGAVVGLFEAIRSMSKDAATLPAGQVGVVKACLAVHEAAGALGRADRAKLLTSIVAASAVRCPTDNKRLARSCRHALRLLMKDGPREGCADLVAELSSESWSKGTLETMSERSRVTLVSALTTGPSSAHLPSAEGLRGVLERLRPTSQSPTGRLIWNDGPPWPRDDTTGGEILSWNIDGLKARISQVLEILKVRRPTVAFFSEIKRSVDHLDGLVQGSGLRAALAEMGYNFACATSCTLESLGPGNYGVMAVSLLRPSSYSIGVEGGVLDREGRCITLRFNNEHGEPGLTVVGSYTPCSKPGLVPDRRLDYDGAMARHLTTEATRSAYLAYIGDQNVAPTNDDVDLGDVRQSHALSAPGCMEAERKGLQRIMTAAGLVDVYRKFHSAPTSADFTWHCRAGSPPAGCPKAMRLDLLLCSTSMWDSGSVSSCEVVKFGTSDHWPVSMRCSPCLFARAPPSSEEASAIPPSVPTDYADTAESVFKAAAASMFDEQRPDGSIAASNNDECIEDEGDDTAVYADNSPWTSLRHCCPTVSAKVGAWAVRALVDTGASFSLMTEACAHGIKARRVPVHDSQKPTFVLADGSRTRPMRLVEADLEMGGVTFVRKFWVTPDGPYEVILGSDFMHDTKAVVDYDKWTVSATNEEGERATCEASGEQRDTQSQEAAAPMYATTDVVVEPGKHILVPASTARRCHVADGSWGIVSAASTASSGYLAARGVTTLGRSTNWVQVANLTQQRLRIRAGKHVADFHRQDKSCYRILDWDLDVEERVDLAEREELSKAGSPLASASACQTTSEGVPDIAGAFADTESPLSSITFGSEFGPGSEGLLLLQGMVHKYRHLWNKPAFGPAGGEAKHDVRCNVELEKPFTSRARVRSLSPTVRDQIRKEVVAQRDAGVIEPSSSPYASTVLLVPKPDGTVRFCIDYRALNRVTKRDGYLMPRVDDSLSALKGAQYFSSLDLTAAFNQIPMADASKDLTSFCTPEGTWRYTRMPFGLVNGPAIFSRFIDTVMAGLKWTAVMVYMDDVLIFSPSLEHHLESLEAVFKRIDEFGLRFKAKKCFIAVDEVRFLGHLVTRRGIKPDPQKTMAITDMEMPKTKDELRSVLGLFGYYRRFCKRFTAVAHPLQEALKKETKLKRDEHGNVRWTEDQKGAFDKLRGVLASSPLLAHPNWDSPFSVHTDACMHGLGATLTQVVNGKEMVVCYASRALAPNELVYNTYEKECLAVVWACSLWYSLYLYGRKFTVVTDNQALTWLFTRAPTQSRIQKWVISLQDLTFDTVHRKGTSHCDADGLSRNHLPSTSPYGEDCIEPLYGAPPPVVGAVGLCPAVASEHPPGDSAPGREGAYFPPVDEEAWSPADWTRLQGQDEECKSILQAMGSADGNRAGELHAVINGILCLVPSARPKPQRCDIAPPSGAPAPRPDRSTNRTLPRVVVPRSLRKFVLHRGHGLPLAGHNGRKRVYSDLSSKYTWKGMCKDVRRWVRACATCGRRKTPRPMKSGSPLSMQAPYPFHTMCIDLVGPLPMTAGGNVWILTMLDCFTRWPIAVAIPDTKGPTIAATIFRALLTQHGRPTRILSDRGKELIGKAVSALCKRWSVAKIATSGYQPQANPVERFHRYLNSAMTALHGEFGLDWDTYLDAALFTYRCSVNDVTGYTPFFMCTGREAAQPAGIDLGLGPEEDFSSAREYADKLGTALAIAYKHAYTAQVASAARNITYRREKSRQVDFFAGQQVFYWQPGASAKEQQHDNDSRRIPNKWRFKWTGPHRIVRKANGNTYVIRIRSRNTEVTANVNRLSAFYAWSDDVPCTSTDQLVEDDPEGKQELGYTIGGRIEVGSLFILPMSNPDVPFAVAKLLSRSDTDRLHFQWVSNARDSVLSPVRPGWLDERDQKHIWGVPPARAARHYVPLTGAHYDMADIKDLDVPVHGFELTSRSKIPDAVLKVVSRDEWVQWKWAALDRA